MKTPLFDTHVKLGARMAPFGGWDMPIQYEGILAEHAWTRTKTAVFDICHMGEFELTGPTAEADLERILTQHVEPLKDGQCRYGYLLKPDGGVLDDLTVYRWSKDRFWLVVNAGTRDGDAAWIRSQLSPGTHFEDISDKTAKLDVQGPKSRADLEAVVGSRLPDLRYFWFAEMNLLGAPCLISRTGYTGEWGYELYFPATETVRIWNALTASGAIKPAGLGCRDTLRLEVGYPLYGHELSLDRTPVGAARGAFIQTKKEFIGKPAVMRDLEKGCARYLVGLALETKRAARGHDKIYSGDKEVGEVTSGAIAPSLGYAVAMAYVDSALTVEGTKLDIDVHGKRLPATVVKMPFYTRGTARG